ncbi:MAG: branched-chain amino acid transaminase [Flavobacteriales bacterium]|nr:branched-chain amino acid transaminase [Flavobacteriales bacterium]MCB9448072.1 branched-chain amino acid transaminase [Flavobacteriales bacterium]
MYYTEDTILFYDGEFAKAGETKASLFSQSLHYGNGAFEGIRSYKTAAGPKIFKAAAHFHRLLFSAGKMHLACPYSVQELTDIAYELIERNNLKDAYIRPIIFAGENMSLAPAADTHVMMATWQWGRYLGDTLSRVMTSSYQRPNPKAFHVEAKVCGHYVNSILATQEARQNGYDEALLMDQRGFVAEGSGANIFFEKDGKLFTPARGNILPGITRTTMLEICRDLAIPVEEADITPEFAYSADSAFFVGTAAEVAGILSLDEYIFPLEWKDSLGYLLSNKYRQIVTHSERIIHSSV